MVRVAKRMTALAGIAVSVVTAGPTTAMAGALQVQPISVPPVPALFWPGPVKQEQSGTCGPNEGLLPGLINLGPMGPRGPLGANGPLGAGHLPCGASMYDLVPNGPHGALGLGLFPGGQL